jgi:hypothetical protein
MRLALLALCFSAAASASPTVAVVPFTGVGDELAIYARPTADAVARALGDAVVSAGKQQRTPFTLELRAFPVAEGVRLEGILRRPQIGVTVARLSAAPVAVADLDRASAELARRARRAISRAERPPPVAQKPEAPKIDPLAGLVEDEVEIEAPRAPAPAPAIDRRPSLAVTAPDGALGTDPRLTRILGAATVALLARDLGFRVIPTQAAGILTPRSAADEARRLGARGALMIRILDIQFAWRGGGYIPVLLAKGRIRFALVDGAGVVRYDETLTTDTLVGSRGDEEGALTRFVLRQAAERVRPELRRALAQHRL